MWVHTDVHTLSHTLSRACEHRCTPTRTHTLTLRNTPARTHPLTHAHRPAVGPPTHCRPLLSWPWCPPGGGVLSGPARGEAAARRGAWQGGWGPQGRPGRRPRAARTSTDVRSGTGLRGLVPDPDAPALCPDGPPHPRSPLQAGHPGPSDYQRPARDSQTSNR